MPALLLVRHCESSGPHRESLSNPDVYLLDGGRRLRFDRVWRADES
jgi:hypothetical protein